MGYRKQTKGPLWRYTATMSNESNEMDDIKMTVRLPRWLRDELNAARQRRRVKRSLNTEIVARLDASLRAEKDGGE